MNWGTKIVLGMAAFMIFIITLVVLMFKVHRNDALVEEDYYEKGIEYDKQYNAKRNVILDQVSPIIEIQAHQLSIQLKTNSAYQLKLIRPSSIEMDISQKGEAEGANHTILLNTTKLAKGLWTLRLEWQDQGKSYLFSKDIKL